MTPTDTLQPVRPVEYRITRELLQRRDRSGQRRRAVLVERLITAAAVTVALVVLGSYLQELLWALLAGGAVLVMGTKSP